MTPQTFFLEKARGCTLADGPPPARIGLLLVIVLSTLSFEAQCVDDRQAPGIRPAAVENAKADGMDHAAMGHMRHGKHAAPEPAPDRRANVEADTTLAKMQDGKPPADAPDPAAHAMTMPAMQGGNAPAGARDPDYSDGIADPMSHADMANMDMHDDAILGNGVVDQLEAFDGSDGSGQSLDAQAWLGNDLRKLWLKVEGERSDGRLEDMRIEALWDHAISAYWDLQAGVRHDAGGGPDRNWAAIGVQGLAPSWFDVEATAYIGESGRTALRIEADYDWRLTQRLILRPDAEMKVYGRRDRARGLGAGLSDLEIGLRLRYEITRKFAPYVGVAWSRRFGETAHLARAQWQRWDDTQLVAGVRFRF